MSAEIFEQPVALEQTLQAAMSMARQLRVRLNKTPPSLVVLVARGSSDNAAQFGRYLIEITTGIPVSLAAPSVVTLYGRQTFLQNTLVIGISQSGESTDTNAVLESARRAGAVTVGVTNEANSSLARLAEYTFLLAAGNEASVAATKTYSCQLLTMYLIAWALGAPIEVEHLHTIPTAVEQALGVLGAIEIRSQEYIGVTRAICLGRGLNFANALEFGLKLMETCYISTDRFSSADLMHGPIALIDEGFPVFLFLPAGPTQVSLLEVLRRLRELKACTLTITDQASGVEEEGDTIVLPFTPVLTQTLPADVYTAIPYIVPAQLFAASLSVAKGLDPDRPRTISKVTRTM